MIICVTGKYKSGKTTVAKMLGPKVISADRIGRDVFTSKKEEIRKLIGTTDRYKIREKVFSDKRLLLKFNKIMHPEMAERIKEEVNKYKGKNIVIDAALAVDLKLDKLCDKIIIVKRNKYTMTKRIPETKEDIDRIAKHQKMPRKVDFVLANNGTKKELKKKVKEIKNRLRIK
jgi:dephospho-CoA kinase